ncbi:MAG: topoisomerase DNA-binding C4 zinc finger domain-containing protein [Oscillospiraceae bacterium]
MRLKVPDEVTEEKCDLCGRNLVVKSGRFGKFLACPGYPECKFTKPIVERMPGRCPALRQYDFETQKQARLRVLRL